MRTVEESVIHRGRVELLLDLLNQLGVSLESGLLADEGRVRGVCQLNDARLNLLQGATLVAEGNCDNLARLVRRDSGGETIGRVSTGGSANVDNGGGHSQVLGLVGSRGRGILLGERRRDVLALRGEGVGDSALERKILLLGRNSGLDGRLSRLADALVGSSASNSLLGGRWLSRHLVAMAEWRNSGRVFEGGRDRRSGGVLVQKGCVLRRRRSVVDGFVVCKGRGRGLSCLGGGEQTGDSERSAVSEWIGGTSFRVKRWLLDVIDVVNLFPITVIVCGLRRAKKLLSLGRKTSRMIQVRLADGLCSVLSQLGWEVNRSSLFLQTSLLGLLILLLLIVVFNDTTSSRNCILATLRHKAKILFVGDVRNHFDVVDRLWNSVENSRWYASKYTFPSRVWRSVCHRDDRALHFPGRVTGSGVTAENVLRRSWRRRARSVGRSGRGGRQRLLEDLPGTWSRRQRSRRKPAIRTTSTWFHSWNKAYQAHVSIISSVYQPLVFLKAAQRIVLGKNAVANKHARRSVLKASDMRDLVRHCAGWEEGIKKVMRRETKVKRERKHGFMCEENPQSASKP
jgi:hypothetical protein